MLSLGENQSLDGSATEASKVTCTISGAKISASASPPAAAAYEILSQSQIGSSAASIYAPASGYYAIISSIHLMNTSASVTQTVTLYEKGTEGSNKIATLVIPAEGFATYEEAQGWQVYTTGGVRQQTGPLETKSAYLAINAAITTSVINVAQLELPAGTWLITASVTLHLTTATLGHVDGWLGPTTASKTSAYVATTIACGHLAGGTEENQLSLATIQTLAAPTIVYLTFKASEATTAEFASIEQTIPQASGILAVNLG